MLSLLADHGFCFLAEQLFLEQLPEDIRLQLSNDDFTNPRALATKADVLWIAKQQAATTINKVISQPNQPDHLISSTGQWISGTFPSAPENPHYEHVLQAQTG